MAKEWGPKEAEQKREEQSEKGDAKKRQPDFQASTEHNAIERFRPDYKYYRHFSLFPPSLSLSRSRLLWMSGYKNNRKYVRVGVYA